MTVVLQCIRPTGVQGFIAIVSTDLQNIKHTLRTPEKQRPGRGSELCPIVYSVFTFLSLRKG